MNVFINSKETELPDTMSSVADLLRLKGISSSGFAVAINNKVVRKDLWSATLLNEGDKVTVITAVCGG